MDSTTINTLVGIIGGAVGAAGIIVTIVSFVRKKTITISTKTSLYINPCDKGGFVFDYSNNDGKYTIGSGSYTFNTVWSKASDRYIHAYKDGDGIEGIACIRGPIELSDITSVEADFSSRCRTATIGDVVIWKNENGYYALTKVIRVQDNTRGDRADKLECEYLVLK